MKQIKDGVKQAFAQCEMRQPPALLALVLMCVLTISVIMARPPLPVDETRYLSVAWEMYGSGNYLVPHLNGETYSHKPPLLFWLINLIWSVTGPQQWAARLAAPLVAAVGLLLTGKLARQLWPEETKVETTAPLIQCSLMLWMVFAPLTMFDAMQSVAVQLSCIGAIEVKRNGTKGLALAGLGIGLGVLAKGPVVLVHALPFMLTWQLLSTSVNTGNGGGSLLSTDQKTGRGKAFASVGCSVILGSVLALCWALPAARMGGQEYGNELLWGQTAGRMVQSFAHRQPVWYYLWILPLAMLPWLLFRGMCSRIIAALKDPSGKACAVGLCGALSGLSLVSGKQVYYLVPQLPMIALLLARMTTLDPTPVTRHQMLKISVGTILAGFAPVVLNNISRLQVTRLAGVCGSWATLPLCALGILLLLPQTQTPVAAVRSIATSAVLFISILNVGLSRNLWQEFDISPLANRVHNLQQQDQPVAWYGQYHGQLQFAGRLQKPLTEVIGEEHLTSWVQGNPGGYVVFRAVDDAQTFDLSAQSRALQDAALVKHLRLRLEGEPCKVDEIVFQQLLRRGLVSGIVVVARVSPSDKVMQQEQAGSSTNRSSSEGVWKEDQHQ